MLWIILYMFIVCVYIVSPLGGRILIFLINMIIPDPFPYIDEVLMFAGIVSKAIFVMKVEEFLEEHPIIKIIAIVLTIIVIIMILNVVIGWIVG